MVLRVKGATHDPNILYVLLFRLNRPYPKFPHAADQGVYDFDPSTNDRDNCFFGRLTTEDLPVHATLFRKLDSLHAGARIKTVLHPLEYQVNGRPKFGRRYVRRPRLETTDVTPIQDGLFLKINSPEVLAHLKRIGCSSTLLY